ncbi:DUF3298 and DUF4163 domain-containing protein [Halalkalibacillus sediminis]|nr:DUF3298 and DUF4163 domain-containing protein [Halalkalibacillus sediminis]
MNIYRMFLVTLLISLALGQLYLWYTESDEQSMPVFTEEVVKANATEYEEIRIQPLHKQAKTYELNFQVPVFKDENLTNFFEKQVQTMKTQFLTAIKMYDQVSAERRGSLYITTDIYEGGEGLYSIVIDEESYTGGANVNQRTKVFLVDMKSKELVDRSKIFKDPNQARDVLLPLVEEGLVKQYEGYVLEDELNKWLSQEGYDFSNLYVRDGAFVFKFNKYEVLAGAAGMPEVVIPISEVKDLIDDEWLKRFQSE